MRGGKSTFSEVPIPDALGRLQNTISEPANALGS